MFDWLGLGWVKIAGAALVVLAIAGAGAYWNGARWETKYGKLQTSFDTFKGGVAALGEKAKADAAKQALHDSKNKERADDENKRARAAVLNDIARLRKQLDDARGGHVPPAPAGTGRPDLACFDRAALESAIRELVAEVRRLVDEGTAATVDLNTAKIWNQGRTK